MKKSWRLRRLAADTGPDLVLSPGSNVLGSSTNADLVIAVKTVSRRHAQFEVDDSGVTVEDLGSTNGTYVNGERIQSPALVTVTAELKVGAESFVLEPLPEPDAVPDYVQDSKLTSGESVLLGPATVGFLRSAGEEVSYSAGEVVVRRGEQQEHFYVVIDGVVELTLGESEARRPPLARIGEGGIFGAESVVSKAGAAVDSVAVTDVRLLRYPAASLPTALQESASLRKKMLGGIARNVHKATADALDLQHDKEVMAQLVQGDNDPDNLVTASAASRAIDKKIAACARTDSPVLILGDPGTGKTLASRLIHDASDRGSRPLIAVNCRDLAPAKAAELILGEDLGGSLPASSHSSGGIHVAHGGTLVLRGVNELPTSVQQLLAGYLVRSKSRPAGSFPDTRVIMTARSDAPPTEGRSGLVAALSEACSEIIKIPPLEKRPKDIMPLAEHFLKRYGPEPPSITDGARQALLSQRYQRRNVAELREVIDLAVHVADGPEIRVEHIFGGLGADAVPVGVDITQTPLLRRLLHATGLPSLRIASLAGFSLVIALCLAAPRSQAGHVANNVIWSVWEPVVFALFFLAGPVWCTICPLSTASRLAKRIGCAGRTQPAWIVRHGPWLAALGFALIVWSERVFDSLANPTASGFLLIALIALAVGFGVVYKREVWCRHLCPLGRLGTVLAPSAPLQVTARPSVCASSCTTHACYKGDAEHGGCPVYHHPLEGKKAYRCKLCLECLQVCPHHSAHLELRPPLAATWRLDAGAEDLALFAVSVTLLALAWVAAHTFEVLREPLWFTFLTLAVLTAGIACHYAIMAVAVTHRRTEIMIKVVMVAMILGWAALMTGQFANVAFLDQARLTIPPPTWFQAWPTLEFNLLAALQVLIMVAGLLLALISLGQVNFRGTTVWTRIGRRAIPVIFIAYTAAVLFLLLS